MADEEIVVLVARIIGGLTHQERNEFMFCILRNHGNKRSVCAGKPWFPKVEALFTAEEGLDKATRDAVVRFVEDGAGRS